MPRPKGSRNRTSSVTVDEQIAAVGSEIESLQRRLKEKRGELKQLQAKKEEEGQKQILYAAAASGRSVEEIVALISGQPREV